MNEAKKMDVRGSKYKLGCENARYDESTFFWLTTHVFIGTGVINEEKRVIL
jgi:hypothetical protein